MSERWLQDNPFRFQYLGDQTYLVLSAAETPIGKVRATHPISCLGKFMVDGETALHNSLQEAAHALMESVMAKNPAVLA